MVKIILTRFLCTNVAKFYQIRRVSKSYQASATSDGHLLFVYGTLKSTERNHQVLRNPSNGSATFVSAARTKCRYPLIVDTSYNMPFLLYCPGTGVQVTGEVYSIDEKMLYNLDKFEGHPDFYKRKKDEVILRDGTKFTKADAMSEHFQAFSSSGSRH